MNLNQFSFLLVCLNQPRFDCCLLELSWNWIHCAKTFFNFTQPSSKSNKLGWNQTTYGILFHHSSFPLPKFRMAQNTVIIICFFQFSFQSNIRNQIIRIEWMKRLLAWKDLNFGISSNPSAERKNENKPTRPRPENKQQN